MAATAIRTPSAPVLAIPVRASVARAAGQSVLELALVFLLVAQVAFTPAIALTTLLLFGSGAALVLVVTAAAAPGRAGRRLEMANAVFLVALLAAAALAR